MLMRVKHLICFCRRNFQVEAILRLSEFKKEVAHNTTYFDWKSLEDAALKRQFRSLSHAGVAILSPEEVKRVPIINKF